MRPFARSGFASFLAFVLIAGCSDDKNDQPKLAQISESCAQAEQCDGGLTCAFSACHATCATTADCASQGGGLCVTSDKTGRVCQNPSEESCTRNSECAGQQICAIDGRCRDGCAKDADCPSDETCTSGVCSDPGGSIGGAAGAGGAAGTGAGGPSDIQCIRSSECPGTLVCVASICRPECMGPKDCPSDLVCVANVCQPK